MARNSHLSRLITVVKEKYAAIDELKSLTGFVGILILAAIITPQFYLPQNITMLLGQVSVIAIAAIGEAFVILAGSIDLSVGSIIGLANVVAAILISQYNFSPYMALFSVMTIGGIIGFFNGLLVTRLRIPSFVTTLATLTIVRGIAYIISGGLNIPVYNEEFLKLNEVLYGVPIIFWIYLAALIILAVFFEKTRMGLYIRAIGSNELAVRNLGVDNAGMKSLAFMFSGICSALAGYVLAVRLGAGYPHSGIGYELDVIAAVVVGGVALTGGAGSLIATTIGAFIMTSILNIMVLAGVGGFVQYVVRGVILLVAALAMRRMVVFVK
ncbi:MAG: ABC transporter permease [Nitrososphaerota archaeon]|nr:ABC transporter permease [Thermoproteota archaeon]